MTISIYGSDGNGIQDSIWQGDKIKAFPLAVRWIPDSDGVVTDAVRGRASAGLGAWSAKNVGDIGI